MKVAVLDWNAIVPAELKKHFEILPGEDFLQADAILATHDANSTQAAMAKTAKAYGIPVFILQHGRFAASDYLYNGRVPAGDYFLAWGDSDVEMAIAGGWGKDQVIKVGAPPLMDWVKPKPDGKTVVFAPAHIEALQSKNAANDTQALEIWGRLRKIKGIKPVIKLLAGEHPEELIYGEKFITSRSEAGHIKKSYRWLLKQASCVVSQAEGTFELLAYSMNIPVVRINEYNGPHGPWNTAADVRTGIDNLEAAVLDALENPDINEHKRHEIVEKEGGGLPCKATLNIVAEINKKLIGKAMKASKSEKCEVLTYLVKEMNSDTYHRLAAPMDKIAECDGNLAVKKIIKGEESAKIAHGLITDLLVLPPVGEHKLIDVAYRLKELGKKVVIDMDDNVFKINPLSQKYYRYGTENVKFGDIPVWQDRKNIDLFTNQAYMETLAVGLEMADMITVPTVEIGRAYERYSDKVKVIPTCIDAQIWKKLPLMKDGTIRIGFSGDRESTEDVSLLKDSMNKIMQTYPYVVFVLIGARFPETFKELPQDRIEYHPFIPFEAMPYKMAILNLDIALIPHLETEYSRYKTAIKWLEYASLEVPTVCSLTYPYSDIDENAGVFIEGNDGWVEGISALIDDSVLRAKIAGDARRLVDTRFDINKEYKIWANAYRGLYN